MKSSLDQTSRLFKGLADPIRLRILCLLQKHTLCVMDLIAVLNLPQPTVSRHLATLKRSGLIEGRKQGLWHFYTLAPKHALIKEAGPLLHRCVEITPLLKQDMKKASALLARGGCCPAERRALKNCH